MIAGITKLINHKEKAAVSIPIVLPAIKLKKNTDTEPLTPISVRAIDGITDMLKKVSELIIRESIRASSIPTNFNKIKN